MSWSEGLKISMLRIVGCVLVLVAKLALRALAGCLEAQLRKTP